MVVTVAVAAAAYTTGLTTCGPSGFVFCIQIGILARAFAVRRNNRRRREGSKPAAKPLRNCWAMKVGVTATAYYAFGCAILGSWDMGIDHPCKSCYFLDYG